MSGATGEDNAPPVFVALERESGRSVSVTYERIRDDILTSHPIPDTVPKRVHETLRDAVDFTALAYEQMNAGRHRLFPLLTREAHSARVRALELALKHRLGRIGTRARLRDLVNDAQALGLLSDQLTRGTVNYLIDGRNAIAHGDEEPETLGLTMPGMIGFVIGVVSGLFSTEDVHDDQATS